MLNSDGKKKGLTNDPICCHGFLLSDKMFPALGFGAQLPPDWKVCSCWLLSSSLLLVRARACMCVWHEAHWCMCVRGEEERFSYLTSKLWFTASHPPSPQRTHIQTHSDKTVSIIHAYSQDYATVNPSVLPWQWADEKDKGERAVSGKRVGRKAEAEMDSAETELWFSIFIFLGVTRICHQL